MTALVLETYGNVCWLKLPGCIGLATTKDHIVPYAAGGEDVLENYRPACKPCNSKRQDKAISGAGPVVKVITGPPAAGKSTYVQENAHPADVVIDLDKIARAFMPADPEHSHTYPPHIRHIAIGARAEAIKRATRLRERVTVWLIHSVPSPDQLEEYRALRYEVVVIDPGRDVVLSRNADQRPARVLPAVDKWYASQAAGVVTPDGSAPPSREW